MVLPTETLNVFCYHVGQLEPGDERDSSYQGRGIGLALLDAFLDWARAAGFRGVVAKSTPADRAVMGFMGGQSAPAYEERGFALLASWVDVQLATSLIEHEIVPASSAHEQIARVGLCALSF